MIRPFIHEGQVCPICHRKKIEFDGRYLHCPHCKRAVADQSAVARKIEDLESKNEKLFEENHFLKKEISEKPKPKKKSTKKKKTAKKKS